MDAVEYVKQCRRMIANDVQIRSVLGGWSAEAVVEQVEQWAKEHPVKTRQSELLKLFPNTDMYNGVLEFCPQRFGYFKDNCNCCESMIECVECKRDFWLKEIE